MAKIAVVTNLRGVGLGNQVQFIPTVRHLIKKYDEVQSDSELYKEWKILDNPINKPDVIALPMWPDWKDILKVILRYPKALIHGFEYRVRGKWCRYGLDRSRPLMFLNEVEQYKKAYGHKEEFKMEQWIPVVKKSVLIHMQHKEKGHYPHWDVVRNFLYKEGFEIVNMVRWSNHYANFTSLKYAIDKHEYFLGSDGGFMHMADICGKKGIVLWGDTPEKNKPVNLQVIEGGLKLLPHEVAKHLSTLS